MLMEFTFKSDGPKIEPCGIVYSIFNLFLKHPSIFVQWVRLLQKENISLRDKDERSYQCHFATSKEGCNAFVNSFKRALNLLPVSIASLNFFVRTRRHPH